MTSAANYMERGIEYIDNPELLTAFVQTAVQDFDAAVKGGYALC